jgi:hypothetical protein
MATSIPKKTCRERTLAKMGEGSQPWLVPLPLKGRPTQWKKVEPKVESLVPPPGVVLASCGCDCQHWVTEAVARLRCFVCGKRRHAVVPV